MLVFFGLVFFLTLALAIYWRAGLARAGNRSHAASVSRG